MTRHDHSTSGALAGLSLAMLLASLGTSIANVALPTLAQAFDASFQADAVGRAGLSAGHHHRDRQRRAARRPIGRRRLLLAGIALFTTASALCGVAPTLWTLIAARAAQGLGAAIMLALAMALVAETVPEGEDRERDGAARHDVGDRHRARAVARRLLIAGFGWRAIFLVTVRSARGRLLAYRHLPADRRVPKAERAALRQPRHPAARPDPRRPTRWR